MVREQVGEPDLRWSIGIERWIAFWANGEALYFSLFRMHTHGAPHDSILGCTECILLGLGIPLALNFVVQSEHAFCTSVAFRSTIWSKIKYLGMLY